MKKRNIECIMQTPDFASIWFDFRLIVSEADEQTVDVAGRQYRKRTFISLNKEMEELKKKTISDTCGAIGLYLKYLSHGLIEIRVNPLIAAQRNCEDAFRETINTCKSILEKHMNNEKRGNTMSIYDYMCDVLHIETCTDCPNCKNWECRDDYSHGDERCLEYHNVIPEDIENGRHPAMRILYGNK